MGILKRLFGKKKKQESVEQPQAKSQEDARDVSLEDVEKGLEDVETVKEDKSVEKETPKTKTEAEAVPSSEREGAKQAQASSPQKESESGENKHYHIKKHSKGWQLIEEGAAKAHRVFQYQKEAVDFAKEEGLDYTVFRADGKPRKE